MEERSSKMTYVVARPLFEKMYERTLYEDLIVLTTGMQRGLDGERSMDPAMVGDWARAVGSQTSFNSDEGLSATAGGHVQPLSRSCI